MDGSSTDSMLEEREREKKAGYFLTGWRQVSRRGNLRLNLRSSGTYHKRQHENTTL